MSAPDQLGLVEALEDAEEVATEVAIASEGGWVAHMPPKASGSFQPS